jgi:ABC-type cobalamin/Fe3+-siderophores transport system ATPase subunit
MSAAQLERLAAARAFKPMEAFDELADNHVDFDELLGGKRREAALAKALQGTTPARVAVLGPSGSGKSSLIAATLADNQRRAT